VRSEWQMPASLPFGPGEEADSAARGRVIPWKLV
jgi:hypothetical protein